MTIPDDKTLKMSALLQEASKNFLLMTEVFAAVAKETKAKYDSYVEAGFTSEQAMELLCADRKSR